MRRGNQICPGKFAGALGCPRLRRTVVHKLVSGFRAETPPLVLEAFRSGREGQTNQSLATLSFPMALRFTTVFNVNAFRELQSDDSVCFGAGRLAKELEQSFAFLFDSVSDVRVFIRQPGSGRPPALPWTRHIEPQTPGPRSSSEGGDCRIYQPPPRTLSFISFFSRCMFSLFSQDLFICNDK